MPEILDFIALAVGAGFVVYFFFGSFLFGAGYEPMSRGRVRAMLALAEVTEADRLFDLGAGTGAIIFPAARERGARVVGIEIDPLRVLVLRLRRALGPAPERVRIQRADLFGVDLAPATVVTTFLWPGSMMRLRSKLESELSRGSRVVSYFHPMPGWEPSAVDMERRLYLYRLPGAARSREIRAGGT